MTSIDLLLRTGDRVHAWLKPHEGVATATAEVTLEGHTTVLGVAGPTRQPLPVAWESPADGRGRIGWDPATTAVSVVYAFSPATVATEGIRIVWTAPEAALDADRYGLHVHPPFGWMNDPNGLCEVDGVTHLFYQHNPHGRRWNTMHWGHAVSRDGIRWRHQPVALLPRAEILRGADQGGAFSGSVMPRPDGALRLFYTDRQDSRMPSREWQMTAMMADGLTVGPSDTLLDTRPPLPGFGNEWRDPFVFEGPDGRLKMLLGGMDAGGSTVLLYETDAAEGDGGWRFVDMLFREAAPRAIPAECPCMIRLDGGAGLWVLIFGLIGSRDAATRRRNLTRAHVGRFDGHRFEALSEHELDFGTDCYATQVWHGADGPRAIAWAANWTDVFADRDFESAMTFPRRLVWQENCLLTPPIDAVATLRSGDAVDLRPGRPVALETGLAEIVLDVTPGRPFTLGFDHPDHDMAFVFDGDRLEFAFEPPGNRTVPRYDTACADLAQLRVFLDIGLIEAFVDGGRACCTKRLDSTVPIGSVWLKAEAGVSGQLWRLDPARPGQADPTPD